MPAHLTVDWDFPISQNLLDHGAIFGLAALVALCAAAWHYRRRFPLASYGFFMFLVLMAPTSSILPIRDPIAERRIYFAMLGLLLIVVDLLGRLKVERKPLAAACTVVVLAAAAVAHARAAVWSDAVTLWEDTAAKSPNKAARAFPTRLCVLRPEPLRPRHRRVREDRPTAAARLTICWSTGGWPTTA